jgi:uncharacterized protein (TIGR03086 family)
MLDLGPAARQMANLLDLVTDGQLTAPTPCDEYTLGDLIDHVGGLSQAFTAAARKELGPGSSQGPSGDAARLGQDWRTRIPGQLAALVEAWRNPSAWEGMTQAGGIDLPADVAGRVALNELVIHGWDVARTIGQPFDCDMQALEACWELLAERSTADQEAGDDDPFGPVADVPADSLASAVASRHGRPREAQKETMLRALARSTWSVCGSRC